MELQVVLIGAVVFVISAVLIYLISAFTMKEKTFEEVIAEQKRQQEEEMLKVKQEKKAEKDHTRKRKKGKEKAKGDQSPKVSYDADIKEPKMVNIELEPEIIEPVEAEKPLKINKKKEKPSKPILHNKDEKTPVLAEEYVEEIVHRGPTPKDDLEMKIIHDKKDKAKKEKNKKQEQPLPVEEVMATTVVKTQSAAPPSSFKGLL